MAACRIDEPVHGGVELERVDLAEIQQVPERGAGALGGQGAGGGQLRLRVDDARDDEGDDEVTDAAGAACGFR